MDYKPLSQHDEECERDVPLKGSIDAGQKSHPYARWCSAIIFGLTIFNSILIISSLVSSPHVPHEYNVEDLEYRSTYIGFDKLHGNKSHVWTTKPEQLINRPRFMNTVWSQEPFRIASLWPTRLLSSDGYLPVAERRLKIADDIATLVQFRTLDYGMENCTLVIDTPASNTTEKKAFVSNRNGNGATPLQVWFTEATQKLAANKLSWSTKPKRKVLLAELLVSYGVKSETPSFHCPSSAYQTFEVSCSGCYIDMMSSERTSSIMYLMQSQSI